MAAILLFPLASQALAQGGQCGSASIVAAPGAVRAGESVTVNATGFAPGSSVRVQVTGPIQPAITTTPVSSTCTVRLSVLTQPTYQPGVYSVQLRGPKAGEGDLLELFATFVILEPTPTQTPIPSLTPFPSATAYSTATPFPTATPYATIERYQTSVPDATAAPAQTAVPMPTSAPSVALTLQASASAVDVGVEVTFTAVTSRPLAWGECPRYPYRIAEQGSGAITSFSRDPNGYTFTARADQPASAPITACITDENGVPVRSNPVVVTWGDAPVAELPVEGRPPHTAPTPPPGGPAGARCSGPVLLVSSVVADEVVETGRPLRVKVMDRESNPVPSVRVRSGGGAAPTTDSNGDAWYPYEAAGSATVEQAFRTEGCQPEGVASLVFEVAILSAAQAEPLDAASTFILQQMILMFRGELQADLSGSTQLPPESRRVVDTFAPARAVLTGTYWPEPGDAILQELRVFSVAAPRMVDYQYVFQVIRGGESVYSRTLWSKDPSRLPQIVGGPSDL